jgi:hypothetical protein
VSRADHIAEARRHLSEAFTHLDAAPDLDELSRFVIATSRGDVQRLIRRLTGLLARRMAPDGGPDAA